MPPSDPRYSLHNVVELEPSPGGGILLRRFPRRLREKLSLLGHMVAEESAGVEIRFVTDSDSFRIALGAEPSSLNPAEIHKLGVTIFRGDFVHSQTVIEAGRVNYVAQMDWGGAMRERFRTLSPEALKGRRFSPDVWRICLGRFPASFIELTTFGGSCRSPLPTEQPGIRWLAYGSSITNGASPSTHELSYIQVAAHRLGVDVFNQGLSGSCLCEPEMADYLAQRNDWDLMTLELGVNMRQGFTPEEFESRAGALISRVASRGKPVAVITIYPNGQLLPFSTEDKGKIEERQAKFNEVLRRIVSPFSNVRLIEGSEILGDFRGLTTDLLHPGDYGHLEMGMNLADQLRELLTCISH